MAAKDPTELASLSSIAGGDLVLIYDSSDGNLKTATQSLLSNTVLADNESIQDAVGGMVSSNTETLITVTYDDLNGKLDFVVDNDLANYDNTTSGFITASSTDTLTNKTFDANGAGNSITNVEVADLAGSAKTGSDTAVVTGTAGTSGNVSIWNVDGDLVDSGSSIADLQQTDEEIQDVVGAMVSTNTETLITVTYQDADGTIDFVVDNNLSNYDNTTSGFITASSTDTLTNKSGNISQWTNDTGFITGSSTTTLTNKTFDANGVGNSITNIETADLAVSAKTGSDTTVVTGTAGTSGNLTEWNVDGDLIDSGVASSDVVSLSGTNTFTGTNTFSGGVVLNAGEIDTADLANDISPRVLIETITALNQATVEFTTGIDSTYDVYEVDLIDIVPAIDSSFLELRTSTDGGSTYDSGASDYSHTYYGSDFNGIFTRDGAIADNSIRIGFPVGSDTNESLSGTIKIYKPSDTTYTKVIGQAQLATQNGGALTVSVGGTRSSAADADAVQFLFSSGNIESGTFKLYGVK